MVWNTGSIAAEAYKLLEDVSTGVSGALTSFANMSVTKVENYTGKTIGTTSIDNKYSSALIFYTAGFAANRQQAVGTDNSWKLGAFEEKKGGDNVNEQQANSFFKMGDAEMRMLGKKVNYKKSNG